MTNSLWVTLHILWNAVSSHLFLWPSGGEWHWIFCDRQSHHIFSWPTASEWHCTVCERQSHPIFSYDQQQVSHIAHFVKCSLITSFPMTNSLWVTFQILWKGSLIISFPMTNSKWVTLHILCKAVFLCLFLLCPTGSQWHCTFFKGSLITSFHVTKSLWVFCESQFHHILFVWPTACEGYHPFSDLNSEHLSWSIYIPSSIYQKVRLFPYLVHVLLLHNHNRL